MRRKSLITMMTTTTLGSSGVDARLRPTALERQRGRYLRSPEGHGDAGAGDGGGASGDAGAGAEAAAGASADGGAGNAGGDQGGAAAGADGGDGAGAAGDGASGEAAGGDKPGTILGEAAAGDGEGGDKSGEGEGEAGAEEGKEGEGDKAVEVLGAPEKYELKVPDDLAAAGMQFDAEAFAEVEPILRELNLSNDAAQAIVDGYATKVLPLLEKRAGERWDATGADMRKSWETESRNDPDIGGGKFDETKALARQTFVRFGVKSDGPFLKLLEESGLGSHPDMLRFVANVGRLTGEATTDTTNGGGQQQTRLADRVYGVPTPRE